MKSMASSQDVRVITGGPERRAEVSAEIAARTGIDDAMI